MQWWLVWTIVGAVVLLSAMLVAVPAMGVRRRVAELNRVKALAQERTTARVQKAMAGSERVQATLDGVQRRTEVTQRKLEAWKATRATGTDGREEPAELPAGRGRDGAGRGGGAGRP